MEKRNIERIIRKYLSDRFSPELEERIQKWIIKGSNNKEKEQASFAYWSELDVKATSETYSTLKRINRKIGYQKTSFFTKATRIVAVIIPLCLIIGGYLYYVSNQNHLIEVSVAYGQIKHLSLPDSSEIWINSGTTLKYPRDFSQKERVIHLNGEAYFSVRKDSLKPFIVQTKQLAVRVLGTKFNVKAYSNDENTTTTLTSGKVEVNTLSNDSKILKPNEQFIYNKKSSKIKVVEISQAEAKGWITGNLIFINVPLTEIIQTLERKFNIAIEYKGNIPISKLYTVKFLKEENLYEVLDILEDMIGFTYKTDNNKIVIH